MKSVLARARSAFAKRRAIWKSKQNSSKPNNKTSNMESTLLYGAEGWRVVKGDMTKVEAFQL